MNVTGSITQNMLHSSVGANHVPASSATTAVYKTNTLDQYGGIGAGRNSALHMGGMVGPSQTNVGLGVHHHRNHASN